MSLRDCINRAIGDGSMDAERGRQAADLYDSLEADLRGRMSGDEAARQARAETLRIIKEQNARRHRLEWLQTRAWQQRVMDLRSYRNLQGQEDWAAGALALFDRDELAPYTNLESRHKEVRGQLHAHMDGVLHTFHRDLLGRTRNKATLRDLVREAFGEDSGNASAKELVKGWQAASELARTRFNSAGGEIPKRADWGLPQAHSSLAVRRVSYQEWRDFIAPLLDAARMIDHTTGRPISPEALELALRQVNETIRTDGWNKIEPGRPGQGAMLANQRLDHRFLVFRDADSWLAYSARFGTADPFSAMTGHLDGMAKDIAKLEILGPNPNATVRYLQEVLQKHGAELDALQGGSRHTDAAARAVYQIDGMYGTYSGLFQQPANGPVGRGFAFLRSTLQAAQLGGAALSSVTDFNTMRMAARFAGIPQVGVMARYLKLMNPLNVAEQKLAVRLGLVAEHWASNTIAQQRYLGEALSSDVGRRLADFVHRVSLLSAHTQAARWAFGMEFMGHLADVADRGFDALDQPLRNTLKRYGLGSDDWDLIRTTPHYLEQGASFLRPDDLRLRQDLLPGRREELATRLLEMIQAETEFAVPSTSLRGQAMLGGQTRPGTLIGELVRSAAMYKSFSVTLYYTQIRRGLLQDGVTGKGSYLASLIVANALMGGLALQLKDIAKGKDPRPMDNESFWSAALLQGGGLGIFGDFAFANVNRFGGSLSSTVAGPVVGFFDDLRKLAIGNLAQGIEGQRTNWGAELTQFLRRYTPGGNVWYWSLAFQHQLVDRLQELVDPGMSGRMRAIVRKAQRETKQGYWWRPGEHLPERAPELGNALGAP